VTPPRRALVLEAGGSPFVLTAVRSLGRAGWHVGLGVPAPGGRVERSRWVRRTHRVPHAQDDLDAFAEAVAEAVRSGGYSVVFCGDDADLLALSAVRERIEAIVPWPPHEAVLAAVDKLTLTRAAERAGLATPHTVEASSEPLSTVALPVLLKPRLHWTPGGGSPDRRLRPAVCATRAEAVERNRGVEAAGGRAILQQPLVGELLALTLVLDRDGHVRGVVQQRTSRVSLRDTSTRARTEPVDEELLEGARGMLAGLQWWGLANLQFLQPPGGRPHLIDLNGRLYGSVALAVRAGIDVPVLWAAAALQEPGGPRLTGRPGVRFSALEEDLRRARRERRGGLVRDVAGSLVAGVGAAHVTWAPGDPVPAVFPAFAATRSVVARVRRAG
jgi:predicted ATP-grasp superfamily ATP-dependent carboligase